MNRIYKDFKLDMFSFLELIFSFLVITVAISVDIGYLHQLRTHTAIVASVDLLYVLNAFALLSVFVTAIGIMGFQLIRIYRRTAEIGLHKAFGAGAFDIMLFIFRDTFRLIFIPAVMGVVTGIILAGIFPFHKFNLKADINLQLLIGCTAGLFSFTILSGIVPAFRAVMMNPADVLRKHTATPRVRNGRSWILCFYIITLTIITGGIYVNYKMEAQFRQDIVQSTGAPPVSGQKVPAFSFKDLEGKIVTSEALIGRNYFLILWGTDCPASLAALSGWKQLMNDGALNNYDVFAIAIDSPLGDIKDYLKNNDLPLEIYTDYKKETKWAFNANALPVAYLVNRDGEISARSIGWSSDTMEYLTDKIKNNQDSQP